ncbi:MAG: pilus assembly protein [Thermodesulfovibrionales bacterium]
MREQNNIFILKVIFLAGLLAIGIIFSLTGPPVVKSSITDYCSTPPFLSNTVPPNILIVLDNSGSMNDQAYAGSYDPSQFESGYYYGYFDPTKMYVYSSNGRWEVTTADPSTATTAHPIASGNFLNWATMRRVDVAKKLLIGGKASPRSPEGSVTVKLYGEDSSTSWDFTKQFDNTTIPGLIYPFVGDYYYEMTGDTLYITPVNPAANSFTVRPNGNVYVHSSWAVTGAPSAWEAVDEVTADGNTTYIQNQSSTNPAIFDYSYSGGNVGTITSIKVYAVARKSSSSTMRIQGVLRLNGVDYPSNWSNLSTSYYQYSWTWSVNPATGLAWQWSEIKSSGPAALEGFGVKAYTQPTSSNYPRVTQVYMVITTSNPSGGPYNIIIDQGMQKAEGIIDHLSSSVKFGLAFYNYGRGLEASPPTSNGRYDGGKIVNYVDFGSTTNMITSISNMSPSTWTPLAETLYEMVRYFRQESPYYSGNSPADYQTGQNYDPYYYQYSKLSGSGLADQYVHCAKSFILMLTDGESTMDENIPLSLRDYDNDGRDPGSYPSRGTDYLDDIAFWARTTDHRSDLQGNQNIYIYPVFMFGRGSQLLKDAAINGGFNDLNGDGKPGPDLREYLRDSNKDGSITSDDLPLTYYEGNDGYELEKAIVNAIADILKRAASGTAVSVLTTSSKGVGSLVQAYFLPILQQGLREVTWTGYLQNLWLDTKDNLREDTQNDYKLILDQDNVLQLYFDTVENETKAATFTTDVNGNGGTLSSCNPQIKRFSEVKYLFEAGKKLALRRPSERTIFTSKKIIKGGTTTHIFTETPYPEFQTTMNSTLKAALDPDATYTADNIIRYIRGECLETGVTGDSSCSSTVDTTYRDRRVELDEGATNGNVWKLGDIISSTPKVFANTPLNTYHIDYSDRTYYEYIITDSYKKKSSIAFVGANDGMLHAFRIGYLKDTGLKATIKAIFKNFFTSGDSENDRIGEEIWAYIPFNAFPYLKYLADPDYCHIYYNDLSVRLVDASIGRSPEDVRTESDWRTVLIGGMRLGGACSGSDANPTPPLTDVGFSSYYAIDITDPENPVPLWEFSDADMGYATTFPSIIRTGDKTHNGNWYVVLGSGTKVLPKGGTDISRTTSGYIYILDLKTGALIQKITLDHNAIVGDILAIDSDKDYHSEKIYFGTAYKPATTWKGKLIRISIPNQDLSTWSPSSSDIKTLFVDDYPFTASPDVAKDVAGNLWVYMGSGKYFSDLDEIDTSTQIFFGLKDKGTTASEDDLYNATNVQTTGSVKSTTEVCAYNSSTNSFGLQDVVTDINPTSAAPEAKDPGWRIYLTNGERVLSRPLAVGGIVDFLTYKPDADVCSFGGNSYLYAVGYTTGVAPQSIAILAPGATSGTTGTVTVYKGVLLGPGSPPTGEAIIIPPPEKEQLKKKIQISTGVIVEAENNPVFSVISKVIHWLKK